MIRKAEEMVPEILENMRGGKGSVQMLKILKPDEFHDKGRLYAKVTLKPGTSIGLHQHVGDFETYYILKGEGKVYDNGTEHPIKAGDLMYTDVNEHHSIENTGTSDMEFMALVLFE